VELRLPNSAHLGNIEGFVRGFNPDGKADELSLEIHPKWVSVHPAVLAMSATAGATMIANGGLVTAKVPQIKSLPYLVRMGLFDVLQINPGITVTEHEEAGRFIPLTNVRDNKGLSEFIVNMIPLLHASPDEAEPIKYVISELVRNALEHAVSPVGAFVCAQYFKKTERLAIGVADSGIGILGSMSRSHPVKSSMEAITLALKPGITGTTSRFGGTEYNAGAGLFFTKAIACASRNFFVAYSGDALFKLRRTPSGQTPVIHADPNDDIATRVEGLPPWQGTVVGIDIGIEAHKTFDDLLREIRGAYQLQVREGRKARYKRPRFA